MDNFNQRKCIISKWEPDQDILIRVKDLFQIVVTTELKKGQPLKCRVEKVTAMKMWRAVLLTLFLEFGAKSSFKVVLESSTKILTQVN